MISECVRTILKLTRKVKEYQKLTDKNGFTVLHEAAKRGRSDCMEVLLGNKVSISIPSFVNFIYFEILDPFFPHQDLGSSLLNSKDKDQSTPLFVAIRHGQTHCVQVQKHTVKLLESTFAI